MNITKAMLLEDARGQCLDCDGAKKLVNSHCTLTKCRWHKYRKYLIDQSRQLSIFTFEGFAAECKRFLVMQYPIMLRSMYWSEIRLMIAAELDRRRAAQPPARWWSSIAQDVLPIVGWKIDGATRTSPINRARENRYTKTN